MSKILLVIIPLALAVLCLVLSKFFLQYKIRPLDLIPLILLVAIQLINNYQGQSSFIPYGLLAFLVLSVVYSLYRVISDRNISLSKTFLRLWRVLIPVTTFWFLVFSITLFL